MKIFENHQFNSKNYEIELIEFKNLLDSNYELSERDLLRFFRKCKNLSTQIATTIPKTLRNDKLAYEYDIFGDFACDIAVGDPISNTYCFIELEDAKSNSLFNKRKGKYKPEYSHRLEHGMSQIIDWFYKIDGLQNSDDIEERFGKNKIKYEGILIIGRDHFLDESLKKRLEWRIDKTAIDSKKFFCYTFDELYSILTTKIEFSKMISR